MSMTKKDFVAIGGALRQLTVTDAHPDFDSVLGALCDVFQRENPKFNKEIFVGYVRGERGPNGGKKQ